MSANSEPDPSSRTSHSARGTAAKVLVVAALILVAVWGGRQAAAYLPQFSSWVAGLGALGPAVFIVGYASAVVAFVPGSVLTLAAGAIFGLGPGTAIAFTAATLGACLAFLVARYFARERIASLLQGRDDLAAVDRAIQAQGGRIVFLLRLSPVFPFSLMNYALGLTAVSFRSFAMASVGMLPGTLLYVYYGKLAGDVAALATSSSSKGDPAGWALSIVGLLATIAVTATITKLAKKALQEASQATTEDPS